MGVNSASGLFDCWAQNRQFRAAVDPSLPVCLTAVNHSFARIWEKTLAWPFVADVGDLLSDYLRFSCSRRKRAVPGGHDDRSGLGQSRGNTRQRCLR